MQSIELYKSRDLIISLTSISSVPSTEPGILKVLKKCLLNNEETKAQKS